MSRFIDEALTIKSFLNNSEFDRMTLPKVMGKIISTLPELTYEQCSAIAEIITLPRPQKLTDKEFLAYKKKLKEQKIKSPTTIGADLCRIMRESALELDASLSEEEIEEINLLLEIRAKKKGFTPYEPDFDKPIGVTADGYMVYELTRKGRKDFFK